MLIVEGKKMAAYPLRDEKKRQGIRLLGLIPCFNFGRPGGTRPPTPGLESGALQAISVKNLPNRAFFLFRGGYNGGYKKKGL